MAGRPVPEGRCSTASSVDSYYDSKRTRLRSPLASSRLEEKEELQELNDRLSRYIEYIQRNISGGDPTVDFKRITQSVKVQLDDLSNLYKDELDVARQNLDSVALKLADCQVKLKSAQTGRDEAQKELDSMKLRHKRSSDEIAALTAELSRLDSELERGRELQKSYDDLMKQHAMVKEQLERETIMRTDLQNRVLTLTEQLEFKDRVLEKERAAWSNETIQVQMRTVAREAEKYRNKLKEKLDELREEMSNQLHDIQSKMETSIQAKLDREQNKTRDAEDKAKAARDECSKMALLLSTRSGKLLKCEEELDTLRRTTEQLEAQLEQLKDRLLSQTEHEKEEIARLLALVDEKCRECAELASIKVQLDAEIAMYRSLLESEESRCHLSPSEKQLTGRPAFIRSKTQTGVKRPFSNFKHDVDMDAQLADAVAEVDYVVPSIIKPLGKDEAVDKHSTFFDGAHTQPGTRRALRITCSSDGPIHFAGADPGDGLLRISNASDEVIDLEQWKLHFGPTRPGAEDYTTLHVFDGSQKLKPHAEMRVHVCPTSGDQMHCIPSKRNRYHVTCLYLVTDSPVWEPYASLITLQDNEGVVRAVCEIEPFNGDHKKWFQSNVQKRSTIRVTCTATGAVHFQSVESGAGILNLCNAGDDIVDFTDWRLHFKCPTDDVSQRIPDGFELEPHGEIRVHLCHPSKKTTKSELDDSRNLFVYTTALTPDYHNSTFTLYDADNVVRAISKIEYAAESDKRKINSLSSSDSAEISDESDEESDSGESVDLDEEKEEKRSKTGDLTGTSFDPAFYARYRQFLETNPRSRTSICVCPMM